MELKLAYGNNPFAKVTKQAMQENIEALQRAIDGKPLARDFVLLIDTKSILKGIQAQLPDA